MVNTMDEYEKFDDKGLTGWVMEKANKWRDHYISNHQEKFEEYYRLWRGQWDAADKTRESERIVTGKQIGRASCRERGCLYV